MLIMELKRTDFLYIKIDGVPRNYKAPELRDDLNHEEVLEKLTEADVEAFRNTQRWIAIGIVAVGGALANTVNQPNNIADFLSNMSIPTAVQTLNYLSFRKGINLMKRRAQDRLMDNGGEQET